MSAAENVEAPEVTDAAEGQAVPLFAADPDSGELKLHEDTVEQVLLSDQLRDSLVIPVSITGAFRRGKSFLLNMLLRYLRSQSDDSSGDWLTAQDAPLTGFPWRGGRKAHTRDLQLWSRPLPVTLPDGQTAHILLLDSQGAFDDITTPTESVLMRSLAGLLSGVHVLNVSQQPQSNDLQQARLCAEYGRLLASAAGAPTRVPRFVLLVRDWRFPSEEPYGAEGGQHVLQHWLAGGDVEDGADGGGAVAAADGGLGAEELQCFLLPYPGSEAAGGGPGFSGAVSQLSPEFSEQLRELAAWLLDAARLPQRQVDGRPLTGAALAALCRSLAAQAASLPPQLEAAADHLTAAAARRATDAALRSYTLRMEATTAAEEPPSDADLHRVHQEAESEARQQLASCPGVEHLSEEQTMAPLTAAIQEHWQRVQSLNAERLQLRAAQADSHNAALAEAAAGVYETAISSALPADGPCLSDSQLGESHAAAVAAALKHFDDGRRAGGPAAPRQRRLLRKRLERQLAGHRVRNSALRQREAEAATELALEHAKRVYQQKLDAGGAQLTEEASLAMHQAAAAAAQTVAGLGPDGQTQLSSWLAERWQASQKVWQAWQRQQAQAHAMMDAAGTPPHRRPRRGFIKIGGQVFRIF